METMSPTLRKLREYYENNRTSILQDFFTFLRFQSISSEVAYHSQVLDCAHWLKKQLEQMPFDVELWQPLGHHPIVFGSYNKAGPSKPTLLIYNHYDVQPVDPLNEWDSPPFEPTIRDGEIYARGAQDNKGQCFYVLQALKAYFACFKSLPINVKWCIEGEEEMGSEGLASLLVHKQKELSADYLVIVDMRLEKVGKPAVTLGVRGLCTMDIELQEGYSDAHSGCHGGLLYNPIHALIKLLAGLRDDQGRITIPGFYDDVEEVSDKEKDLLALDLNEDDYQEIFGIKPSGGEKQFRPLERAWLRPTLEVNGIEGGYHGPGFKTVIPAKAQAKVSCRLVPHQDPEKIAALVSDYCHRHIPEGMKLKIRVHPGKGKALRADVSSPIVQVFLQAYADVFVASSDCLFSGGSIPIATELARVSKAETVLVGVGLPDDQIHAPNEHFGVDRLEQGFWTMIRALELLGEQQIHN